MAPTWLSGLKNPGEKKTVTIEEGMGPVLIVEGGGGIWGTSGLFLRGFGRRGGTRRLKFATTSGGEWRLRVG